MSDIDLTEAVARVIAGLNEDEDWPTNDALGGSLTGTRDDEFRDGITQEARDVLYVIEPLIAAQVRAQIAGEIEASRDSVEAATPSDYKRGRKVGMTKAAAIARGDAK